MIYFIVDTNIYKGDISLINGEDITILNPIEGISSLLNYIDKLSTIGYDIETNGLDSYINKVIVWTFGDNIDQYVIHSSVNIFKVIELVKSKTLLGHNIKFDIKFVKVMYNILLTNLYDTMIAEQCIFQKSGMSMSLTSLTGRYLNKPMFKEIREEFIGCNPNTFQLLNKHIRYAANDIVDLFSIKEKQEIRINQYKLNFKIYEIEFPLISIIAKAELEGFNLDINKWKELYNKNVKRRFELECLLDEEVRRLRDIKSKEIQIRLKGGKFDHKRIEDNSGIFNYDDNTTNVLDLFGNTMSTKTLTGKKKKVIRNSRNTNYNSADQIIDIFAKLEEPLMTEHDTISIPKINKRERSVGYQTNSDAFEAFLKIKPNCITKQFIEYLIEYGSVSNMIKNFGLSFLNKINPITDKIHTIYRQATADTGRFQSGGGKKEDDKPNFQNIPRIKDYRNCFLARPNCSIDTADYSGAELMIMVSVSQDQNLFELSKGDMHSTINQAVWRNIFKYRYNQLLKLLEKSNNKSSTIQENLTKLANLSTNFVVSKEENLEYRNKNLTFGTIYGMYPKKAGKTLNVTKEEGQIAINTIKGILPKIFSAVEGASKFVSKHGYIIINNRTNSRAWFPLHIKMFRGEINKDDNFKELQKELSEARNIRIQGTQADFVKEATVVLQQYIDYYNLDVIIKHWVHDEIVTDQPKKIDGVSNEWKEWINKNPKGLSITIKGKKFEGLSFPEVKELIMCTVANRYLKNVEIQVERETLPYWTK